MFAISLFHGRTEPNQQMDDWGFNGPIIIDVNVSWCYGRIRLHGNDDFVTMPIHEDMVELKGNYYGDFSILNMSDLTDEEFTDRERITLAEFKAMVEGNDKISLVS